MTYSQDDKKISIKYTITDVGFSYNVRKSELKKGSTISKRIHPVKQVEDMKTKLLKTGKLRDCGDDFILKNPLQQVY